MLALLNEYERAILLASSEDSAHHLMIFYWTGAIGIEDPLIKTFFARVPDEVRSHAIGYIGRSLAETTAIPPNILERLRELWTWRLRTAQASKDILSYQQELAQFGWWFCSRKFGEKWGLDQLRAVPICICWAA